MQSCSKTWCGDAACRMPQVPPSAVLHASPALPATSIGPSVSIASQRPACLAEFESLVGVEVPTPYRWQPQLSSESEVRFAGTAQWVRRQGAQAVAWAD